MLSQRLGWQAGYLWMALFFLSAFAEADRGMAGGKMAGEDVRKIVVIRHAQSLGNATHRYSTDPANEGYFPAPLTELGKIQAAQLAIDLLNAGYNCSNTATIISSSLPRARETAEIIASALGFDREHIHIDDRVIERNLGQRDGQLYKQFDEKDFWYPANPESFQGETDLQVRTRMMAAWDDMTKWEKSGHILLVSHGQPIHSLTEQLTGQGERISNATFIEFLTDGTRLLAREPSYPTEAASSR